MNTYNQKNKKRISGHQARRLKQEENYNNYSNELEQQRIDLSDLITSKTQKCEAAENPIGFTIEIPQRGTDQMREVNYTEMYFANMSRSKAIAFFSLLDPDNFGDIFLWDSTVDLIKTTCEEADCFHPCYGATHESSCNTCKNGFEKYLRERRRTNISDEDREAFLNQVKETCKRCQVPQT